ncbi:hypothetical protein MPLDJ20_10070 [Mesorhizobium plurifarium]|uniref:Uncharacterized protein n=1 Tax=Mesorhizobium plurifarium TaxID=69974 RepID=A0A090F0W6_MESPL|nr:hypothetical protein MPLDJ20_10070 [Mesorhizobium plurifarium]
MQDGETVSVRQTRVEMGQGRNGPRKNQATEDSGGVAAFTDDARAHAPGQRRFEPRGDRAIPFIRLAGAVFRMRQRHQPIDDRTSLAGREQGVDFAFVLHTFRLLLSFPPQEPRLYEFRDGCLKARTGRLRGSTGQSFVA